MASLKNSDQALATALVVTSETISSERFGRLYKVLANVRGQALVFDFKAMTVLRAYPINVTYLDVLDHQPSEREKRDRVKRLLLGGDKPVCSIATLRSCRARSCRRRAPATCRCRKSTWRLERWPSCPKA